MLALDAKVNLRRQRPVPPSGHRAPARPARGGTPGGGSRQVRAELHPPGRQHRLHGQRRRPGHGHHGHHQVLRRANRPTSWTSAAPRRRSGSRRPSRSCSPIRTSGRCSSTSSAASCAPTWWPAASSTPPAASTCAIPVVVRLVGTNEEEGQRILRESGLNFVTENDPGRGRAPGGRTGRRGPEHVHPHRSGIRACSSRDSPAAKARSMPGR